MTGIEETDFLVVGSGLAGLYFALQVAERGRVLIVTKRAPDDSNTNVAQGGIAGVFDEADSHESHEADTLRVGAGLCREEIVRITVEEGPAHIQRLKELGVRFSPSEDGGGFDLGREGGHSHRRVVHAADITGQEVQRVLLDRVLRHPNVRVADHCYAVDLLTTAAYGMENACFGAYVQDVRSGGISAVLARCVFLASGGAGKVYLYTTNPDVATGDGIAMAYRAGAAVANMEFYQFHPTLLYHPHAKNFLISEALRGEGGILRLADGTDFMAPVHELGSLAPRDVVARTIDSALKRSGDECVFLDMTGADGDWVERRFPNIYAKCMSLGIDMRQHPIPVVPAAHYCCGGVLVDQHGATTLRNLLAAGEVACTGLHGACRLASNSLLEALVFAARAATYALTLDAVRPPTVTPWQSGSAVGSDEAVVVTQNWDEIRRFMWNYVGIVRSTRRLERARRRIELIRDEIREYYWNFLVTPDLLELRNLALVAHLIIESARRRKESRGLHYNTDCPETDERYRRDTVLSPVDGPQI
ncbi:MAG: L-aspartate oxidase [Deltaproteobacteria bacterium]|nr:L-aspartate oxidase [Deltaproteobacteria bacterium]